MKYLTTIISVFIFLNSYSQKYSGQIIDKGNNKPVPYVNIGVLGKNVGTVSDNEGKFQLELNDKYNDDTLRVTSIGYENHNFRILDFKKNIAHIENCQIKLTPKIYQISEVVVSPKKIKIVTLGNSNKNSGDICIISSIGLGSEIGLIMKLPRNKAIYHLKSFSFNIVDNVYGIIPARVNIYDLKNGLPNNNILKTPVFIEINKNGLITIDLNKYDIEVREDFFISVENINKISLEMKLKYWSVFKTFSLNGTGHCLYRSVSQGNWLNEPIDEVRFSVEAEYEKK